MVCFTGAHGRYRLIQRMLRIPSPHNFFVDALAGQFAVI